MPKRLTPDEVLERAKRFIDEAAVIHLPEAGQERGVAVRMRRGRLNHASRWLWRITSGYYRKGVTAAHRERAAGLGERINQLWPEILSHKRYRERRERQ